MALLCEPMLDLTSCSACWIRPCKQLAPASSCMSEGHKQARAQSTLQRCQEMFAI